MWRLYQAQRLQLSKRHKKCRLPERVRQPLAVPESANQCWSMYFMSDALTDGRRFRTLNVVEDCSLNYFVNSPSNRVCFLSP
ncbi:hypothetical protein D0T11_11115 [Hymenobacter rubripertinctus]|uniref:Transposase n=1 Tax=Hymenobacter rubripertinctus TaxID=2029981 RepID=A0A418QX40_9BACT|nr:hypothetical protein D0T11_11115 [Hymenobacter rubripertinctus]